MKNSDPPDAVVVITGASSGIGRAGALKLDSNFQDKPAERSPGNLSSPMKEWNTVSGGCLNEDREKGRGKLIVGLALLGVSLGIGIASIVGKEKGTRWIDSIQEMLRRKPRA